MGFEDILAVTNISASGLSAERFRLEVVANNIANANSTRTSRGGPFRRQEVVFEAVLDDRTAAGLSGVRRLGGVRIVAIEDDLSDFHLVSNPGHPDADENGKVMMPNVNLPIEMVNMMTASRAYEANLKVLRSFRQMAEQALSILVRG